MEAARHGNPTLRVFPWKCAKFAAVKTPWRRERGTIKTGLPVCGHRTPALAGFSNWWSLAAVSASSRRWRRSESELVDIASISKPTRSALALIARSPYEKPRPLDEDKGRAEDENGSAENIFLLTSGAVLVELWRVRRERRCTVLRL